jgi:RNase P subunit RPR2
MAATTHTPDAITEACTACGTETPHDVRIEIRTESERERNARYSREPYRVTTCLHCGDESTLRMNNA